jgi:hypothetical protein
VCANNEYFEIVTFENIELPINWHAQNSVANILVFLNERVRAARVHPGWSAVPEYRHTIFLNSYGISNSRFYVRNG